VIKTKAILPTIAFVLWTASNAAAQARDSRFSFGGSFQVAQPKEEFRFNVGNGYGGGGTFLFHFDRPGWISARFDGSYLQYGSETKRVPFSETVGSRVLVDVHTTNSIVALSIGPEVAVPRGPLRPYVNAAFAGLLFQTVSTVEGVRFNDEPIAGTTNASDWTRAWVYGAGIRIPLPQRTSRFEIDLGLRYHRGGEASYLREGSITDNPDGSITINPLQSRTPFLIYAVGFRYRIPWQ
jgi:hypothetical protein